MTAVAPRSPAPPQVDAGMIGAFAEVLFDYVEGPVAVRILTEKGRPDGPPWTGMHPADDRLPDALTRDAKRAAGAGRALFVVPATVKGGTSATADNIAERAVLIVDVDEGDIEAKRLFLVETLGPATLTVASGGVTDEGARKLHLFWRLTEAARGDDLERIAALQATLAAKAGGDPSFGKINQPIRVAGSLHGKADPPRLVEIIEQTDHEVDLSDAEERARKMPMRFASNVGEQIGRPTGERVSIAELKNLRVRSGGRDRITRFDAMSSVIGYWLRRARVGEVNMEEAWAAVWDHNQAMIEPPWGETKLRREFNALLRKDRRENPEAWAKRVEGDASLEPNSEDALAAALVDEISDDWLYVPETKAWLSWTGEVWRRDRLSRVADLARLTCRAAARTCDKPTEARRLASEKTIQAVERIAASDPRITIEADELDADPMLLNAPGGVIDLATGEVGANRPEHRMTRIAGASPGGERGLWLAFIDDITGEDRELASYLKRLAGYCLTGSTDEQAFFFLHGAGANGKSVFLDVLSAALGDYARTAPFETFAATRLNLHPTDLAGLHGARLVTVTETDRDRDWAESRIKAITGGDPISVRFMRRDFFTYRPTFKLIVAGNHRPGLRSIGEAMRRRLHLVPFEVTIPPERRDRNLQAKLKAELGGVLAWMIEGCAEWRAKGLAPPERVKAAAEDYFADEDLIGQWIDECCRVSPEEAATSRELFASWQAFADTGGHPVGSAKTLGGELKSRGFEAASVGRARGWRGIGLIRSGAGS